MKIERMVYVVIGCVLMGLALYLLKYNQTALEIVSASFMGMIGGFLGVEMAVMLNRTSNLPKGEYEPAHKGRYIFSVVAFLALLIETLYIESHFYVSLGITSGNFLAGSMLVIGLLVSGLSANRIVQDQGPVK